MRLEDFFDGIAKTNIFGLKRGRFSGVVVATARDLKNRTDTSNAMGGALVFVEELAETGEIGAALFGALLGGSPCGGEAGDVGRRVGEIVKRERTEGGEVVALPGG